MKKRIVLMMLGAVIVIGAAIGGTLAWLSASTDIISNTFVTDDAKIAITLTEATPGPYYMVPGKEIKKDPVVTVDDSSLDCYLFVKLDKSTSPAYDTYLDGYKMADGWTKLTGTGMPDNVYYRTVMKSDTTKFFHVIANDTVKVLESVTRAQLNALEKTYPTLTVTAYATQYLPSISASDAWETAGF